MAQTLEELAARLDACEVDLEAHRGYLKALEYGLRTIIASHPSPHLLPVAWNMALAGVADAHAGHQTLTYNTALQQGLQALTQQFNALGQGRDQASNFLG